MVLWLQEETPLLTILLKVLCNSSLLFSVDVLLSKVCFVYAFRGICHTKQEDPNLERLQKYFRPLADCYERICEQMNKTREFYGLRDYYW